MSPRSPPGGRRAKAEDPGGRRPGLEDTGPQAKDTAPLQAGEGRGMAHPHPPAPEATRPTRTFTSGRPVSRTLESRLLERPKTPNMLLSACVIFSPEIQALPPGLCDLGQVSSPCWGRFPCHPWAAAGTPSWRAFGEPPTPATQTRRSFPGPRTLPGPRGAQVAPNTRSGEAQGHVAVPPHCGSWAPLKAGPGPLAPWRWRLSRMPLCPQAVLGFLPGVWWIVVKKS